MTIEKKSFDHHLHHNEVFANNNNTWVGVFLIAHGIVQQDIISTNRFGFTFFLFLQLHDYDLEPQSFKDRLFEFPVTFPPRYNLWCIRVDKETSEKCASW